MTTSLIAADIDIAAEMRKEICEALSCQLAAAVTAAADPEVGAKAALFLYSPADPTQRFSPIDQGLSDRVGYSYARKAQYGDDVLTVELTSDGHHGPKSRPIGWVQVYVGAFVLWGWRDKLEGSIVRWSDVTCVGRNLYWSDGLGRRWLLQLSSREA